MHPYFARRFAAVGDFDRERATRDDEDTRARMAAFRADDEPWAEPPGDALTVDDLLVPGRHGDVPVRRYRPRSVDPDARPLVWLHGGGFAAGTLDWPEAHVVSAELALRARTEVVSVGYRLAGPGTRYPVPLDDAHDAARWAGRAWATGSAAAFGGFALGGASAGAALALGVAARLRDEGAEGLGALLLAYPFAHHPVPALDDATAAVMRELPLMLRFFPSDVERMVRGYVGRIADIPAEALPGALPLGGLPATSILLAEFDELRPSGELLARQLTESGVTVRTELAEGVPHGHLNRLPGAPQVRESIAFLAEALRRR